MRKNEEVKYLDTVSAASNITWTAGTTLQVALFGAGQGSTAILRNGDHARIKSIKVKGYVNVGTAPNVVRLILYQWHPMSSGTQPLPADILETTLTTGTINAPDSMYNVNNQGHYTILWDKRLVLTTDEPVKMFEINITSHKFLKRDVHWTAGSSSLQSNGLFLMGLSDDSISAFPTSVFVSRVRFTDA